ncbi:hypothetical protein M0P65_04890 [Candidatus Gracilibacteria bacterium]|nr:hypothetical protein [Candidatus Gracilibacteria bacterium]
MEPHKEVFLRRYNLTPEEFDKLRLEMSKECSRRNKCNLKDIPECCVYFRNKVEDTITSTEEN